MNITLEAGKSKLVPVGGETLYFLEGDGKISVRIVEFGGEKGEPIPLYPDQGIEPRDYGNPKFQEFIVENLHGSTQTFDLYVGNRALVNNRALSTVSIDGSITMSGNPESSYGAHNAGIAAALILAADPLRASCLVQNLSTGDLYIGSNSLVLTTTGIKVGAGKSMVITFEGAIYGIGTKADIDIRYLAEGLS